MILILTDEADVHADAVIEHLDVPFVRFDPGDYPARAAISVDPGTGLGRIRTDEGVIDLAEVGVVWHRRPSATDHEGLAEPWMAEVMAMEARFFFRGLWGGLPRPQVPAPRDVVERADLKPVQLAAAIEAGLTPPPTLITSDPREALAFVQAHDHRVITKPLHGYLNKYALLPRGFHRYTEVISRRDLGYLRSVRHIATVFQAYVPKQVEVRVTVIGDEVSAAAIHSQATAHTRHDWRRYDHANTPVVAYELPDAVAASCRALVRSLGLRFGAIDLVLTPDDEYVFLEINPNGQYLWVELLTGQPLSERMAAMLTELAAPRALREAV